MSELGIQNQYDPEAYIDNIIRKKELEFDLVQVNIEDILHVDNVDLGSGSGSNQTL